MFHQPLRRSSGNGDFIAPGRPQRLRQRKETVINSLELALGAAQALDDKLARDIRVLDVRGVSSITDYCVVASGTSAPHLKALMTSVLQHVKQHGTLARSSGLPESGWVVVDCLDAVIHIFAPEARSYYAIETLWKEAKPVPLPPAPAS